MLGCLLAATVCAVGLGWLLGARSDARIGSARAEVSSALTDYLGSLDVLIAFDAEAEARERVRAADRRLRRVVSRSSLVQAAGAGLLSLIAGLASVLAVVVSVPGVASGAVGGPWLAVVDLVSVAVFEVFAVVPLAAASWRSVRASALRIAQALPAVVPAEVRTDDGSDAAVEDGTPALQVRGLRAGWPGSGAVLRGVDPDLAPGERVLVRGTSGAGKSTLAAALVGFLNIEGEYRLGGQDARALSGPALRRSVGLVEQAPHLFDEDIRQNLLFARDTASDADLTAVPAQRLGGTPCGPRGAPRGRVPRRLEPTDEARHARDSSWICPTPGTRVSYYLFAPKG